MKTDNIAAKLVDPSSCSQFGHFPHHSDTRFGWISGRCKHEGYLIYFIPYFVDSLSIETHEHFSVFHSCLFIKPKMISLQCTYTVNDLNQLVVEHWAETTVPCPIAMTNHAYWNLDNDSVSEGRGLIFDLSFLFRRRVSIIISSFVLIIIFLSMMTSVPMVSFILFPLFDG